MTARVMRSDGQHVAVSGVSGQGKMTGFLSTNPTKESDVPDVVAKKDVDAEFRKDLLLALRLLREEIHNVARPKHDLNHCRSLSTRLTSAIGTSKTDSGSNHALAAPRC